ncbi:MAG: hypothetical protein JNL10_22360 [Verrucomicrobiales bacterium]|nr:hypothetical protein [Verrucomicrobiales bacterium]
MHALSFLSRGIPCLALVAFSFGIAAAGFQAELDVQKRVVLRWTHPGPVTVESSPSLGAGSSWKPVLASPDADGRSLTLTPAESRLFYRIREGSPLIRVTGSSPQSGEHNVSVLREVILRFSEPLPASASLNSSRFYTEANGRKLLGWVELAEDRTSATLFPLEPIPGNARVRVTLDGTALGAEAGRIDFDGDSIPGGTFTMSYHTHDNSAAFQTAISGRVVAAEKVRDPGGNLSDHPLAGVTITVDGAEEQLRAVTDSDGRFRLSPCPAGRFFVHIDGRTAAESQWPGGAYYPVVGKTWTAVAGRQDNLANDDGEIFLPRIPSDALRTVDPNNPTIIGLPASVVSANPALAGVQIVVPAGSLFSDSGSRGGRVGLALVPRDRLPEPLPSGLKLPVVITVQTDGPQNFREPAAVRFPNLPDPVSGSLLAPGTRTTLWSFNHDSGRWEVQGPATVTADGQFVESDPGVGIRQPGWHGVAPGVPATTPPPKTGCEGWEYPEILDELNKNLQRVAGTGAEALASQIYCLANAAAQHSGTWGGGFVQEELREIACLSQSSSIQNWSQYPCTFFPPTMSVSLPGTSISFTTGDLCFAVEGGGYHTIFELFPGLWKNICQVEDAQHDQFIQDGMIPCLGSNPALGPTMALVGQKTVPVFLTFLRESMQLASTLFSACDRARSPLSRSSELPSPPPAPTEADLRVPEIDAAATLQVDTGGVFFVQIGTSLQLHVSKGGTDITSDPGTHYSGLITTGMATVTAQGLVTALSTSNSLPGLTPTFYVVVSHGTDNAIVQLALRDVDTDGDWMVDSYERNVGLDPNTPNGRGVDTDQDGLDDFTESMYLTSPTRADSDGDGIPDPEEISMDWNPRSSASPSDEDRIAQGPYFSLIEDLETGVEFRAYAPNARDGLPAQILAPDRAYRRWIFSPMDGRRGSIDFVTSGLGTSFELPQPTMRTGTGPDTDLDGLDDEAEFIVGTNRLLQDTDGDGKSDGEEVLQGTNPLAEQARPTGLISSLALPGSARSLTRQGNRVHVAAETGGLVIANVEDPEQPRVEGQLSLTGSAFAVAVSEPLGVAAVAASSATGLGSDYGLHFVDISTPANPRRIRTLSIPVQAVAEHHGRFLAGLRQEVRILDAGTGGELGWIPTRTAVFGLRVAGDRLYVATQEGLEIHDLSVFPPRLLGWTSTTDALVGQAYEGDMVISQGILHAATGRGYLTMDVSNPTQPVQLALSSQVPTLILHGLALNGSGRMGSLVSFNPGARDISLFDATNPLDPNRFLTSFPSRSQAHDLEFMGSLILVADANAGLSIVNTTGPDARGNPPAVTVDFSTLDQDPQSPGIQVLAGSVLPVDVGIFDDVQMRQASLWVDGQSVATRDSGPVLFDLDVPATRSAGTSVGVQIHAVDTAGSETRSPEVRLELVPDTTGPVLVVPYPQEAGFLPVAGTAVALRFNEVLGNEIRDLSLVEWMDLGPDRTAGGTDDRRVPVSAITANRETLYVNPGEPLASSSFSLRIPATLVKDRAGNPMASDLVLHFGALPVSPETLVWSSPDAGLFSDPNRWMQRRTPNNDSVYIPSVSGNLPLLVTAERTLVRRMEQWAPLQMEPGSTLTVSEGWMGHGPVTITDALAVLGAPGNFDAPWVISGGTFFCKGPATFGAGLSVLRGGQLILQGPTAAISPAAAFNGNAFTFRVEEGATASLPQFSDYSDTGDFTLFRPVSSTFVATGAGSRLTLPSLTQGRGPVDWAIFSVPSLALEATSGGILELPQLGSLRDRIRILVSGAGSRMLAPGLDSIDGPPSDFLSSIEVSESGELRLGPSAQLERCQVRMGAGGVLRSDHLGIGSTASLDGSGTLAGSVEIEGIMRLNSLPNTLEVQGNLELAPSSVLETTIAFWNGRIEAGRLRVQGTAALGGILRLVIPNPSLLHEGEEYEIIGLAQPAQGSFASMDDSALGSQFKAELVTTPTGIRVRILAR